MNFQFEKWTRDRKETFKYSFNNKTCLFNISYLYTCIWYVLLEIRKYISIIIYILYKELYSIKWIDIERWWWLKMSPRRWWYKWRRFGKRRHQQYLNYLDRFWILSFQFAIPLRMLCVTYFCTNFVKVSFSQFKSTCFPLLMASNKFYCCFSRNPFSSRGNSCFSQFGHFWFIISFVTALLSILWIVNESTLLWVSMNFIHSSSMDPFIISIFNSISCLSTSLSDRKSAPTLHPNDKNSTVSKCIGGPLYDAKSDDQFREMASSHRKLSWILCSMPKLV